MFFRLLFAFQALPFIQYLRRQYLFAKAYLLNEMMGGEEGDEMPWWYSIAWAQRVNDEFCDALSELGYRDDYDYDLTPTAYQSYLYEFLDTGKQPQFFEDDFWDEEEDE